jgi:hypothetical protein
LPTDRVHHGANSAGFGISFHFLMDLAGMSFGTHILLFTRVDFGNDFRNDNNMDDFRNYSNDFNVWGGNVWFFVPQTLKTLSAVLTRVG